jgi:glycine cleavage system H protein
MSTTYYSEEHEWITVDGDIGTVGITDYAQEQLGDVVFVDISKAASDIYSPVSGTITEANPVLDDAPETVNAEAQGGGWMFKITLSDTGELDGLMDADGYKTFADSL